MTRIDYTAYDAELLAQINAGRNKVALLDVPGELRQMAHRLPITAPSWRVLDRRLQALRLAGKIAHDGKVWSLTDRA